MPPSSDAATLSAASPGSSESSCGTLTAKEIELQRKRARDRKSQQAMRDRTRWTISTLNEQVSFLGRTLDDRTRDVGMLESRLQVLETENAHLRAQNAALQLSLIGFSGSHVSPDAVGPQTPEPKPWELPPLNSPPSCIADQILQGFLESKRQERLLPRHNAVETAAAYSSKPTLCSLLDKSRRSPDDISNVVGDIIRSYLEIDTLPKQVACFYLMTTLVKWMVLMDEQSWNIMPDWLRPIPSQLTTAHASWVDRIPWPQVRAYLVAHPEISLDHFAAAYSSSFSVSWPYDPSHVLIKNSGGPDSEEIVTNPVYEEHIRQLKNWTVGDSFRHRFPEIALLIDKDSQRS